MTTTKKKKKKKKKEEEGGEQKQFGKHEETPEIRKVICT